MNVMLQVGDFFMRLRDKGDRPKLTVWNSSGNKVISEFISSTSPTFWEQIASFTSQEVVDKTKEIMSDVQS